MNAGFFIFMAKKINTVVAKAIITTAANEASEARAAKQKEYKAKLPQTAEYKKLLKLRSQRDELLKEINVTEDRIEELAAKAGFTVTIYSKGFDVNSLTKRYDQELLVAECILMSEAGKTIDQIKGAVRKKLMS